MARVRKNSAKVNLTISVLLHIVVIAGAFIFAAREGILGKKLQEIAVVLVPKEKPVEPPKPPPIPRIEPPKEEPKVEPPPKAAVAETQSAAPPPSSAAPAIAPAAVIPADFSFADGAKAVESSANAAVAYYKNYVEYTLRENWNRPEDMNDNDFVDLVEVQLDSDGNLKSYSLVKSCGNKRWDESVLQAITETRSIGRQPPTNFPPKFTIRFDVTPATEPLTQ